MGRWLAGLLIAATIAGGCGGTAVGGGAQTCEIGAVGPEFCAQAIELAKDRLGWQRWVITSTEFRISLCPPGARCRPPLGNNGWVIFTLLANAPVVVHVGPAEFGDNLTQGSVADESEPAPEWLVEELDAGS